MGLKLKRLALGEVETLTIGGERLGHVLKLTRVAYGGGAARAVAGGRGSGSLELGGQAQSPALALAVGGRGWPGRFKFAVGARGHGLAHAVGRRCGLGSLVFGGRVADGERSAPAVRGGGQRQAAVLARLADGSCGASTIRSCRRRRSLVLSAGLAHGHRLAQTVRGRRGGLCFEAFAGGAGGVVAAPAVGGGCFRLHLKLRKRKLGVRGGAGGGGLLLDLGAEEVAHVVVKVDDNVGARADALRRTVVQAGRGQVKGGQRQRLGCQTRARAGRNDRGGTNAVVAELAGPAHGVRRCRGRRKHVHARQGAALCDGRAHAVRRGSRGLGLVLARLADGQLATGLVAGGRGGHGHVQPGAIGARRQ